METKVDCKMYCCKPCSEECGGFCKLVKLGGNVLKTIVSDMPDQHKAYRQRMDYALKFMRFHSCPTCVKFDACNLLRNGMGDLCRR